MQPHWFPVHDFLPQRGAVTDGSCKVLSRAIVRMVMAKELFFTHASVFYYTASLWPKLGAKCSHRKRSQMLGIPAHVLLKVHQLHKFVARKTFQKRKQAARNSTHTKNGNYSTVKIEGNI